MNDKLSLPSRLPENFPVGVRIDETELQDRILTVANTIFKHKYTNVCNEGGGPIDTDLPISQVPFEVVGELSILGLTDFVSYHHIRKDSDTVGLRVNLNGGGHLFFYK